MNNTLKSILIIGGTFIIGLILGGLIVAKVIHGIKGNPEKHMKRLFSRGLDLTDAQQSEMEAVLLKHRPKREQLVDSFETQKDALLNEMTSEIQMFLEPDQIKKLNKRIERVKKRHHHRHRGKRGREKK